MTNKDKLIQKLKEVRIELGSLNSQRRKYASLYHKIDEKATALARIQKSLSQELEGLNTELVPGLYRRQNRYEHQEIFILVTGIRRPKKYTHVTGIQIRVTEGDWGNAELYSFESNVAFMRSVMKQAIQCEKLTFLTTEGVDMNNVIEIAKAGIEDRMAQYPVTGMTKVTSDNRFANLTYRSHNYAPCDFHKPIERQRQSSDSG